MLSLSTSYFANDQIHGPDIVERLNASDIRSLELSYKIDLNLFAMLKKLIGNRCASGMSLASIASNALAVLINYFEKIDT